MKTPLVIPSAYRQSCPRDLPDLTSGKKPAVQSWVKRIQKTYHDCASRLDALLLELEKQNPSP